MPSVLFQQTVRCLTVLYEFAIAYVCNVLCSNDNMLAILDAPGERLHLRVRYPLLAGRWRLVERLCKFAKLAKIASTLNTYVAV